MIITGWRAGVVVLIVGAAACIIPDKGIHIQSRIGNPAPVRILERPPLHPQMESICNQELPEDPEPDQPKLSDVLSFCPDTPRSHMRKGWISSPDGPFCVCPGESGYDMRALPAFQIHAEDASWENGKSRDALYGVLLLDPDPGSDHPGAAVAYPNYLGPCAPGRWLGANGLWPEEAEDERQRPYADFAKNPLDPLAPTREPDRGAPTEARDTPPLWRFTIEDFGSGGVVDFCNNNNHRKVSVGLHNLQFLVTDRPFFRPTRADGSPGHQQCGVPDIAAGATFAVTHWVFECLDGSDPQNDCACGVEE